MHGYCLLSSQRWYTSKLAPEVIMTIYQSICTGSANQHLVACLLTEGCPYILSLCRGVRLTNACSIEISSNGLLCFASFCLPLTTAHTDAIPTVSWRSSVQTGDGSVVYAGSGHVVKYVLVTGILQSSRVELPWTGLKWSTSGRLSVRWVEPYFYGNSFCIINAWMTARNTATPTSWHPAS